MISDKALIEGDVNQSSDRHFVTSLARGLEILRAFPPGEGPIGNNELAKQMGLGVAMGTRDRLNML